MIATSRRGLLGMFAAGAAAVIVRTPGLLMPIKPLVEARGESLTLTFIDEASDFPPDFLDGFAQRIASTLIYGEPMVMPTEFSGFRHLIDLRPGAVNRGPLLTLLQPPERPMFSMSGAA